MAGGIPLGRWGHVFGRRHVKTRQELVRAEFGESLDLFRQAAAHAAGGLGATVGPRYGAAKTTFGSARGFMGPTASRVTNAASTGWDSTITALAPLAEAARQGSAKAEKLESKKANQKSGHSGLVALLAAGTAVGVAGALVARRRNRARWTEYASSGPMPEASSSEDKTMTENMAETDASRTSSKVASWAKGQTRSAYDTARQKVHDATGKPIGEDVAASVASGARKVVDGMSKAGEPLNEGASHLAEKAEVKMNDASTRVSESSTTTRTGDSADDLTRSAKNSRM